MSNENRKRAALSGWARRRGTVKPVAASDAELALEAYRAAKAKHDAAITALKAASGGQTDPELIRRQAEAAAEEIDALSAVCELARPSVKPDAA